MSTKTILTVIVGIVILGAAAFIFSSQSDDFEVMVLDDVSALEQDLATVEAQIDAGTMNPDAAAAARVRIINKLETINAKMEAAGSAKLTNAQRTQLSEALTRLKSALVKYQDALVSVDAIASKSSSTSGSSKSLSSAFLDIVASSEAAIVAADVEIDSDTSIEATLDEMEDTVSETIDEIMGDLEETASSTDEIASTTDDVMTDEEGDDVSSSTTIEADVSIETENPVSE